MALRGHPQFGQSMQPNSPTSRSLRSNDSVGSGLNSIINCYTACAALELSFRHKSPLWMFDEREMLQPMKEKLTQQAFYVLVLDWWSDGPCTRTSFWCKVHQPTEAHLAELSRYWAPPFKAILCLRSSGRMDRLGIPPLTDCGIVLIHALIVKYAMNLVNRRNKTPSTVMGRKFSMAKLLPFFGMSTARA